VVVVETVVDVVDVSVVEVVPLVSVDIVSVAIVSVAIVSVLTAPVSVEPAVTEVSVVSVVELISVSFLQAVTPTMSISTARRTKNFLVIPIPLSEFVFAFFRFPVHVTWWVPSSPPYRFDGRIQKRKTRQRASTSDARNKNAPPEGGAFR